MRSSGVHHVALVVSSIERSLPFYRDLLGPLGWHGLSEVEGERGETIWYLWGPGTFASVGLRTAQSETPGGFDRYRIGLHHLAFEAYSRRVVDAPPPPRPTRRRRAVSAGTESAFIPSPSRLIHPDWSTSGHSGCASRRSRSRAGRRNTRTNRGITRCSSTTPTA